MRRAKPLRRHSWIKRRPTRKKPGEDRAYRRFVRSLPCAASAFSRCWGPVDPHHAGKRLGVGLKASDRSCIPLCRTHHDALHALTGPFARWDREIRTEWLQHAIEQTQMLATPDSIAEALDYQEMGLGTWDAETWTWTPGTVES